MPDRHGTLLRRDFLFNSLAVAATSLTPIALPGLLLAAERPGRKQRPYQPIVDRLPDKPREQPLNWRSIADQFDAYIMDSKNGILIRRKDGMPCFASATESATDGGLTTFAPVVLGKALRGEDVSKLLPSLAAYFNESAGIFMDGTGAQTIEYWYLMNINALAAGLIRQSLGHDVAAVAWLRRSADRLIQLAHQIDYDFNEQGYDFAKKRPWTAKDIYRQPDAVGGYAYLMLFAHEMLGDKAYLIEARAALDRYQSFKKNPWYEISSGAMACLAAARLSAQHNDSEADLHKALSFALDPDIDCMRAGEWGGKEVNGLMGGWCTEPPGQAYSMESMAVLPYLLPVLRYDPRYATDIGRYALNVAANMRWFYGNYLPPELQSKPGVVPAVPYERLSKQLNGHIPYAAGDFAGHQSIYGGAYALWFGEMIRPTQEPYILQLNLTKTDFLANAGHPSYLYYNPWPQEREVTLNLEPGKWDIYETLTHRFLHQRVDGSPRLVIPPSEARVMVVIPSGQKRSMTKGVFAAGGTPVDYHAER